MKIKKRQFARLKDIAEEVNTCGVFGLTGLKLGKLIADIESVQKRKVEDMIYAMHRKDVENNIQKEGESMVAASANEGTYTEGLRKYLSDSKDWKPLEFGGSDFTKTVDADPDPKIGDIGYFWDTIGHGVYYGILESIEKLSHFPYFPVNHKGNQFKNFSKTPPELK